MTMTCPYCKKEFKASEYTTVATCNHCFKSFRKNKDIPMSHDMGIPLGGTPYLGIVSCGTESIPDIAPDTSSSFDGGGGGDFGDGGASGDF